MNIKRIDQYKLLYLYILLRILILDCLDFCKRYSILSQTFIIYTTILFSYSLNQTFMKFNWKNTTLLLVLLLSTFTLWSCKGDDEINPEAVISALIDGQPWNASSLSSGIKTGDNISLTAASSNGRTFIISFKAEVGTQALNASVDTSGVNLVPSVIYRTLPIGGSTFASNICASNDGGEIVITAIDETNKTVTGTFKTKTCSINSSVEITEGKINGAKYN